MKTECYRLGSFKLATGSLATISIDLADDCMTVGVQHG